MKYTPKLLIFYSFIDKLLKHILDYNSMTLKGNELAISKLQTARFYHRNCKSYVLLSMMARNKIFYMVNTFSLKLSM